MKLESIDDFLNSFNKISLFNRRSILRYLFWHDAHFEHACKLSIFKMRKDPSEDEKYVQEEKF